MFWNLCLIDLLISILCSSFSGFRSVILFGPCFFVTSFWQPPCVCFFALRRAATSPRLGRVAWCSKCTVRYSGTASPITQAGYSWCPHCVDCVYPPIIVEPWFLLAHPRSATSMFYPESHSISYRVFCSWLLLLLGLGVPKRCLLYTSDAADETSTV